MDWFDFKLLCYYARCKLLLHSHEIEDMTDLSIDELFSLIVFPPQFMAFAVMLVTICPELQYTYQSFNATAPRMKIFQMFLHATLSASLCGSEIGQARPIPL